MLASITPLGERGRHAHWAVTVSAFAIGATAAAIVLGALIGALGEVVADAARRRGRSKPRQAGRAAARTGSETSRGGPGGDRVAGRDRGSRSGGTGVMRLEAHGLRIELPAHWSGRVFSRAHGLATLHAADFQLALK